MGQWNVSLPRNSESEAATKKNYDTKNTKHHDAYYVPINENRLIVLEN